ncbi:MAG TPA: Hsp20/alpha crystallin family protein [Candidatus Binataceae bacterium]|nr:Hsp20/alpha crystallin family protein [Candidatus Binataceae bacterium]
MADGPQAWSARRELDRVRRDFDDLFDRFLGGRFGRHSQNPAPAVEAFVDNGRFVVRADLPGVDPKDVEITANGDQLTIRGKRERRLEERSHDFIHREILYGEFERVIRLPSGVSPDDVKASYSNGVLELSAPLPEQARSRKVPIQSAGGPGSGSGTKS